MEVGFQFVGLDNLPVRPLFEQEPERRASLVFSTVLHGALLFATYPLYVHESPVDPTRDLTAHYISTRIENAPAIEKPAAAAPSVTASPMPASTWKIPYVRNKGTVGTKPVFDDTTRKLFAEITRKTGIGGLDLLTRGAFLHAWSWTDDARRRSRSWTSNKRMDPLAPNVAHAPHANTMFAIEPMNHRIEANTATENSATRRPRMPIMFALAHAAIPASGIDHNTAVLMPNMSETSPDTGGDRAPSLCVGHGCGGTTLTSLGVADHAPTSTLTEKESTTDPAREGAPHELLSARRQS